MCCYHRRRKEEEEEEEEEEKRVVCVCVRVIFSVWAHTQFFSGTSPPHHP